VRKAFTSGFFLPLRAAKLLLDNRGLKRYAALPLLANLFIYACVFAVAIYAIWNLEFDASRWQFWGDAGSGVVTAASGALKWIVALPLMFVFSYFTFTLFGMVLASPFNDLLSARVEAKLDPSQKRDDLSFFAGLPHMFYCLWEAIIMTAKQLLAMLLVLPFLVIPVVGPIPLLLVTAYFSGRGFVDVAMARNYLRGPHKRTLIHTSRAKILGLGLAMELLFLIPFVGLLVLPIGVAAGTMLYCQADWRKLLGNAQLEPPKGFVFPANRDLSRRPQDSDAEGRVSDEE
jgi:CysZ protein